MAARSSWLDSSILSDTGEENKHKHLSAELRKNREFRVNEGNTLAMHCSGLFCCMFTLVAPVMCV